MRAEEFGGFKVNNVGKGGRKPSYSAYNKSLKGHERNPSAKEFYSQGLDEYHHYSEFVDTRNSDKDEDKKKNDSSNNSSQSSKTNSASKAANQSSSLVRNIVSRVAVVAVGAVVVVNEYQVVSENETARNLPTLEWVWSEDLKDAKLEFIYQNTYLNKEFSTDDIIIVSQKSATCNEEGYIVYSASIEDEGEKYTNEHTKVLTPLGHDFDEHIEEENIDGVTYKTKECKHCHEKFIIGVSGEDTPTD